MAKSQPRLVLDPVQAIPLDRIDLSQANVRRIKNGVSIEALADDIDRRSLLQSLNVRPRLDADGQAIDRFEAPAGGRRYHNGKPARSGSGLTISRRLTSVSKPRIFLFDARISSANR